MTEINYIERNVEFAWLCFTRDHPLDDAEEIYLKRYGVYPACHFIELDILHLGPVKRNLKWQDVLRLHVNEPIYEGAGVA